MATTPHSCDCRLSTSSRGSPDGGAASSVGSVDSAEMVESSGSVGGAVGMVESSGSVGGAAGMV